MLLKYSVCFAVLVIAISAGIPYDEIGIKIGDDDGTIEMKIKEALTTTKNFFASDASNALSQVGTKIVGFVPYVKEIAGLIPALQKGLAFESDWKEKLEKAIPDQTQRAIAENDVRNMEASMETVKQNIYLLRDGDDFTSESKTSIVHNIHDDIDKIVNKFVHEQSIFRKYPLIAVSPLFALASFISVFNPVENAFVPELGRLSYTSCKFSDALKEYRSLATRARLEKITVVDQYKQTFDIQNNLLELLNTPYNEYGYNKTNSGIIECISKECTFDKNFEYRQGCIRDSVDATEYFAGNAVFMYGCVLGYMELVRYRVEHAFIDPMYLVDRTCSEVTRNRPRKETGSGWLTITINKVTSYELVDGSNCDTTSDNPCDPYVKVLIEGKVVFTTSKKNNSWGATYFETFKTSKVKKMAKITIEMWDDDSGFGGSADDLMQRTETTIDQLLTQSILKHGQNSIFISTEWKNDYDD